MYNQAAVMMDMYMMKGMCVMCRMFMCVKSNSILSV